MPETSAPAAVPPKAIELVKVARRDGQHFESATWLHKAQSLPKEQFKAEVERELTGRESEPSELIYFKVYKSQAPVIEQAIDTAALILGSDKGAGVLSGDAQMICADFLAGAHLVGGNPKILLLSMMRLPLPATLRRDFLQQVSKAA